MVKQKLLVFSRIKPCSNNRDNMSMTINNPNNNKIILQTCRTKLSMAKQQHEYGFEYVFDQTGTQDEIFRNVAKPVIDNSLKGYNGTIFAYGQTGSGKTYTMSGGDSWQQRGIIPRVLSYIFEQFQKHNNEMDYQLSVSYIEIYNQSAYDLLNQSNSESNFESWQKITVYEDDENKFFVKNANINTNKICKTQEQALDCLMMGNYLRKVSCTSLNQASSRSHCIFMLNIRGINRSTSTEIYSKINLVDLAGSERVSKSHAQGIVLTEAKSINLSLSYLQQVIVSLNQKSKGKSKCHIPYRNSLLTTLLKDSLGGNCKTVMIATISSEITNVQETISTLRFSQRVRQIKNEVQKNEKNSLQTKLQILERQNLLLKKKLQEQSTLTSYKPVESSPPSQKDIQFRVQAFINDRANSIKISNVQHANIYFLKIKQLYNKKMKDYVQQLTYISQKIIKYDLMLDERQKKEILRQQNK